MKLEKAMGRLQRYLMLKKPEPLDNFDEAIQLNIEALKRIEDWRAGRVTNPDLLLPGETWN